LQEEDCQRLSAKVSGQLVELKDLRDQVKMLKTTELELQQFVEMFEQVATDPRDAIEAKKAERRARVQVGSEWSAESFVAMAPFCLLC
jgi:hypothetical protein